MAFYIADRTYTAGTDRKPEAMGFIEGYTSDSMGKVPMLRMNIKCETDTEKYEWYKRLYGEVPHDVGDIDHETLRHFLRDREIGDVTGDGIRLDRGQVIRLIWELLKWLVRGY